MLSALVYIWLCEDPGLTFVGHIWPDFSEASAWLIEEARLRRLVWISIYVLLSTTGLAWLLRVIAGRRPDASQAQSYRRMSGLLLGSICAMLVGLALLAAPRGVLPYFMTRDADLLVLISWLPVSIEVAGGNKMAFRVGVAELLFIMLYAILIYSFFWGEDHS